MSAITHNAVGWGLMEKPLAQTECSIRDGMKGENEEWEEDRT